MVRKGDLASEIGSHLIGMFHFWLSLRKKKKYKYLISFLPFRWKVLVPPENINPRCEWGDATNQLWQLARKKGPTPFCQLMRKAKREEHQYCVILSKKCSRGKKGGAEPWAERRGGGIWEEGVVGVSRQRMPSVVPNGVARSPHPKGSTPLGALLPGPSSTLSVASQSLDGTSGEG